MKEQLVLNTGIRFTLPDPLSSPVQHAYGMIRRDIAKVLGVPPDEAASVSAVLVKYTEPGDPIHGLPIFLVGTKRGSSPRSNGGFTWKTRNAGPWLIMSWLRGCNWH